MNPEVKAKWLEALHSGEFRQGRSYLARTSRKDGITRHCCLGVLCELAEKEGVIEPAREGKDDDNSKVKVWNANDQVLPEEVQRWAGLRESNPTVHGFNSLAHLNDSGKSFRQIAKEIEENL